MECGWKLLSTIRYDHPGAVKDIRTYLQSCLSSVRCLMLPPSPTAHVHCTLTDRSFSGPVVRQLAMAERLWLSLLLIGNIIHSGSAVPEGELASHLLTQLRKPLLNAHRSPLLLLILCGNHYCLPVRKPDYRVHWELLPSPLLVRLHPRDDRFSLDATLLLSL